MSERVVVERRLPATPAAVFEAWVTPASMAQWLAPEPLTVATVETDPVIGGAFLIVMQLGDERLEHRGHYLEVDHPRRLVFTWVSPGTGGDETIVSLDLTAAGPDGAETDLRLVHERLPSDEARRRHASGWSSIVDRLGARLGLSRARQAVASPVGQETPVPPRPQ